MTCILTLKHVQEIICGNLFFNESDKLQVVWFSWR